MYRILTVSALAAISTASFSTASMAAAPVVTENITGTIGGSKTVDTHGYFGKAGTDLSGATVSIYLQYVPKLFGASQACRTHACTYNESVQAADTQGSLLVTVSVNGQRVVYSPTYEGVIFFSTQAPYQLTIDSDAFSGFGIGLPALQLGVPVAEAPLFGQALSPGSPPVRNVSTDYVDFFTANSQTPREEITFAVTKATK